MSRIDRIAGTLLGLATGDALGAGYEFQPEPLGPDGEAEMVGGGIGAFAPGEWTDDTSMAVCIAEVTATGSTDVEAIGERFLGWLRDHPKDVGVSTRAVLGRAASGADLARHAAHYFAANPRGAAGNGSLMRTAPVALATLETPLGDTAALARDVSDLTHGDPLAGDACVLWCAAIRVAIEDGTFDGVRDGLGLIDVARRDRWAGWLDEAEDQPPSTFAPNGFVVPALQAAYAAIVQTPVPADAPPCLHLQHALHNAIRVGHDTDTVAAIAGALLGARWGASAIPFRWRRMLHGWPGYRAKDLVRLAVLTASGGRGDAQGWPAAELLPAGGETPWSTALPDDQGLVLGNLAQLESLEVGEVDAIVSLCRVGTAQPPADAEHHEVFLVDQDGPDVNPNLEFVLTDAADAIATLRGEGKHVFLHCLGGRSRTPIVAALYLVRHLGLEPVEALKRVAEVTPYDPHNRDFREALDASARRLK